MSLWSILPPEQRTSPVNTKVATNHLLQTKNTKRTQRHIKVTRLSCRLFGTYLIVPPADRYLCTDVACLKISANAASSSKIPSPPYFSTWSALQAHTRDSHPPTCLHSKCNGRTFNSQKNLKAHLRTHEDQESEQMEIDIDPLFRRGPCVGRDWQCEEKGCTKSFKSVGGPQGPIYHPNS